MSDDLSLPTDGGSSYSAGRKCTAGRHPVSDSAPLHTCAACGREFCERHGELRPHATARGTRGSVCRDCIEAGRAQPDPGALHPLDDAIANVDIRLNALIERRVEDLDNRLKVQIGNLTRSVDESVTRLAADLGGTLHSLVPELSNGLQQAVKGSLPPAITEAAKGAVPPLRDGLGEAFQKGLRIVESSLLRLGKLVLMGVGAAAGLVSIMVLADRPLDGLGWIAAVWATVSSPWLLCRIAGVRRWVTPVSEMPQGPTIELDKQSTWLILGVALIWALIVVALVSTHLKVA